MAETATRARVKVNFIPSASSRHGQHFRVFREILAQLGAERLVEAPTDAPTRYTLKAGKRCTRATVKILVVRGLSGPFTALPFNMQSAHFFRANRTY